LKYAVSCGVHGIRRYDAVVSQAYLAARKADIHAASTAGELSAPVSGFRPLDSA
jgi:hypothetical protein